MVKGNNIDIVELLLNAKADVLIRNEQGLNAIDIATQSLTDIDPKILNMLRHAERAQKKQKEGRFMDEGGNKISITQCFEAAGIISTELYDFSAETVKYIERSPSGQSSSTRKFNELPDCQQLEKARAFHGAPS